MGARIGPKVESLGVKGLPVSYSSTSIIKKLRRTPPPPPPQKKHVLHQEPSYIYSTRARGLLNAIAKQSMNGPCAVHQQNSTATTHVLLLLYNNNTVLYDAPARAARAPVALGEQKPRLTRRPPLRGHHLTNQRARMRNTHTRFKNPPCGFNTKKNSTHTQQQKGTRHTAVESTIAVEKTWYAHAPSPRSQGYPYGSTEYDSTE